LFSGQTKIKENDWILAKELAMRTFFSMLSIFLLLLAIASFITSLVSLWPTLVCTIPKLSGSYAYSATMKKAIGTVTDVHTSTSSSKSLHTGNSYSTGSTTVKIQFHDEKGHLFEIICNPIINIFKEKSSVKVSYLVIPWNEKDAERRAKSDTANPTFRPGVPTATSVKGVPISLYYWLERPVLFLIIGIVLLILRFPANQFRNFFP
jgi:hypothetical protein